MFAIVVRFDIFPEHVAAFDALMLPTVAAIRTDEPGTLVYVCCKVESAPSARVFMEVYADRAAFDTHVTMPATVRFLEHRTRMIAGTRIEYLTPYVWKIPTPD